MWKKTLMSKNPDGWFCTRIMPAAFVSREQIDGRTFLWIHQWADTDIAPAAKKSWSRGFCWKDIAKLTFTASQPNNARSFVGQMPKVQMDAERGGSLWRYWRSRFWAKLGRKV
jgi:hypothetical protein